MDFSPTYVYKIWSLYLKPFLRYEGVPKFKSRSRDPAHAPSDVIFIFVFKAHSLTYTRKIWGHSLSHSRDMKGVPEFKSRSRDPAHAP